MTARGFLYKLSRFLGDIDAAKRGRLGRRIVRRRVVRGLFRGRR